MFTKRHYEAIAKILKEEKTKDELVLAFADLFTEDNPLFDKWKFAVACGIEPITQTQ